ncbi:hypothetical protein [Embleya hyalina]|nr:hypothetical protein [Embleya hyalina]
MDDVVTEEAEGSSGVTVCRAIDRGSGSAEADLGEGATLAFDVGQCPP